MEGLPMAKGFMGHGYSGGIRLFPGDVGFCGFRLFADDCSIPSRGAHKVVDYDHKQLGLRLCFVRPFQDPSGS